MNLIRCFCLVQPIGTETSCNTGLLHAPAGPVSPLEGVNRPGREGDRWGGNLFGAATRIKLPRACMQKLPLSLSLSQILSHSSLSPLLYLTFASLLNSSSSSFLLLPSPLFPIPPLSSPFTPLPLSLSSLSPSPSHLLPLDVPFSLFALVKCWSCEL